MLNALKIIFILILIAYLGGCQDITPGMRASELTASHYWGAPKDKIEIDSYGIWRYQRHGVDYIFFLKGETTLGYRKYSPQDKIRDVIIQWANNARRFEDYRSHLEQYILDIINERVRTGMTPEEARLSLGAPDAVNKYVDKYGNREEWTYQKPLSLEKRYLVFTNGTLTESGNR